MPYCRRCGTKLEEDAHFCHKCGTPVILSAQPAPHQAPRPIRNDPIILIAIVLSAVLIVGVFAFIVLSAPFATVAVNQTYQDNTVNINKLNLTIQTDGTVNVIAQKINNDNFLVSLQGQGAKRLFGGESSSPVTVEFYNNTQNGALTVTAKIVESTVFSSFTLNCTVYINPALTLNLNITSNSGQVSLSADEPATFESINLQANAGTVEADLQNATITGPISLKTQLGTVHFGILQATVIGNQTVDLHSNAGTVNMDITQADAMQGNLIVNAATSLGSANVGLQISGDVGGE